MGRRVAGIFVVVWMTLFAACGGSGGGGGGGTDNGGDGGDGGGTVPSSELCNSEGGLEVCLAVVGSVTMRVGETRPFVATVRTTAGRPRAGEQVTVVDGSFLDVAGGQGATDADGKLQGTITARFGGTATLRAIVARADQEDLSVFIRVSIQGQPQPTPTITQGGPGAATPTARPAPLVRTIYMETDVFAVSAAKGGTVTVRAFAFDQDNQSLNGVQLLFDFSPKIGILRPIATQTRQVVQDDNVVLDGVAEVQIVIPPNTAEPGAVTVSASAGGVSGSVTFSVVPGNARRPVQTVLLQASDATCGAEVGGSISLTSIVFDADNNPLDGVNVLFLTPIGQVIPLTSVTTTFGGQPGTARTTLQIPPGSPVLVDGLGNIVPYTVRVRAGAVEGSVQVFVVPGRDPCGGDTGGELGEPASVTLSASPNRIRVRGAGSRELSSINATVFDNRGNRLPLAQVRFRIDPDLSVASGATLLPANPAGGFCSETVGQPCGSPADCPEQGESCPTDPSNRFTVFTDRAGNAQIQLRSGGGLGTVTVLAEVLADGADDEFTDPCLSDASRRCIRSRGVAVTVTAGLPRRTSVSINDVFISNNDGTLLTTMNAVVTDDSGNTVDDGTPVFFSVIPFDDTDDVSRRVGVGGFAFTNDDPNCDTSQFPSQTGLPVVPQPGTAITCISFPIDQAGTDIQIGVESANQSEIRTVTLPGAIGFSNLLAAANPNTVVVTESQSATSIITAVVIDDRGNPVRNVKLVFETDPALATLQTAVPQFLTSGLTNDSGIVSVPLTVLAGTRDPVPVSVFGGGISRVLAHMVTVQVRSSGAGPGSGSPQTISLDSVSAPIIGVRGAGLTEQSVLTFSVHDQFGNALGGVPISFILNQLGGARVDPADTVTDENGMAKATVVSGRRAEPLQLTAAVDADEDGSFDVVTQFTPVNVVGAPPTFDRFSLAAEFVNIAGRVTLGLEDEITAFLNDRFGNAIPQGTVVNFITNGASVFE
jgi:hypothetical protein